MGDALRNLSARRRDLSWTYESWVWASTVAHHGIPLVPAPGVSELPPPTFAERSIQLWRFLHVYVNYGMVLLQLEHPANVPAWHGLADAFVKQRAFQDALRGRLDRSQDAVGDSVVHR